ncbi:MAG TPA: hypothetical protein VMU03_07470, partial [Gammaproteobacteria bacterium]|nr:hypothetical protein [Gammaproteobacteria bacterium]
MLTLRRKPVSPPGTVRGAVAGAMTQRLTIEELEPWILMSADPAPWLAVIGAPPTADGLHEQYGVADGGLAATGTVGSTALDLDALVASSAAQQGAATTRVELAFIDSRIADADRDAMLADLASRTDAGTRLEVVVIDSGRDGLAQIDEALAGRE